MEELKKRFEKCLEEDESRFRKCLVKVNFWI